MVDEYGNVPYSEALQGADNVTPHYDNASTVYQSLVTEIDAAIAQLKAYSPSPSITTLSNADLMFGGDVTKWIQFANNIKLRILIRAQKGTLASFTSTAFNTFSSEGFLLDDVLIQPGYVSTAARQNPLWNSYQSTYTNAAVGQSTIPTTWIYTFYNGTRPTWR